MKQLLVVFLVLTLVKTGFCHDEYRGKCPEFQPMDGFNWDRFQGRWYVVQKFDTTNSKCNTYEFQEDENGFMFVDQVSELTGLQRIAVDNKFRYKGRLTAPFSSSPANMIVRFPLNVFGTSSFVVMDTDYDNYALICTCQSKKILFDFLTFHRRSCSILQRKPEMDREMVERMHGMVNAQINTDDDDLPADHDFDDVTQVGCSYDNDEKGLQIDVDKILGSAGDEITDVFKEAAEATVGVVDDFRRKFIDDPLEEVYKYDEDYTPDDVQQLPLKEVPRV